MYESLYHLPPNSNDNKSLESMTIIENKIFYSFNKTIVYSSIY
jgi:hypothetical protein